MNLTIMDTDSGRHFWTARQCAEHCQISPSTWRSYAGRGHCPPAAERFEGLPLWDADEVQSWHAARPGSPVQNAPTSRTK